MDQTTQDAQQKNYTLSLGKYQTQIDNALKKLREKNIVQRIWQRDHTVWKPEPDEITNRLGWLDSPKTMQAHLPEIESFVERVRDEGFTYALLLGMGGSSLAPAVFSRSFGMKTGYLDLAVLDSTDPGAVLSAERKLDFMKTLFFVSTKSGGTVETLSFFKYFYNRVAKVVGDNHTGKHFVAITDPGSRLEATAKEYRFRKIFLNDPNIGGRFSALSYFGLVPAALTGVDLQKLLARANKMALQCKQHDPTQGENPGALLGVIMGELAAAGRDKLTLILSPQIASFGAWVEQLVAESTGKDGVGILPIATEPVGTPDVYADDRLFVHLRLADDTTNDAAVRKLAAAGHPVLHLGLRDEYDLGSEFFRWEFATAVACWKLGMNPFDQPNVESAKVQASKMMAEYQEKGVLPELTPVLQKKGISVCADDRAENLADIFDRFFSTLKSSREQPRAYVALQAFIQPAPASDEALKLLATKIRDKYRLATTYGYGPRFLHSTGQLHKGDAGKGLFIQITANMPEDAAIPYKAGAETSSATFGVLKMAQALGDHQALIESGRRVVRFDLGDDVVGGLKKLAEMR